VAAIEPLRAAGAREGGPTEEGDAGSKEAEVASNADDITAELARLFEEGLEPQPIDAAATNARKRPGRKGE
jgi:hypothetical protein